MRGRKSQQLLNSSSGVAVLVEKLTPGLESMLHLQPFAFICQPGFIFCFFKAAAAAAAAAGGDGGGVCVHLYIGSVEESFALVCFS